MLATHEGKLDRRYLGLVRILVRMEPEGRHVGTIAEITHMAGKQVHRIPAPAYLAELRLASLYNTPEPKLLHLYYNVFELPGSAPPHDADRALWAPSACVVRPPPNCGGPPSVCKTTLNRLAGKLAVRTPTSCVPCVSESSACGAAFVPTVLRRAPSFESPLAFCIAAAEPWSLTAALRRHFRCRQMLPHAMRTSSHGASRRRRGPRRRRLRCSRGARQRQRRAPNRPRCHRGRWRPPRGAAPAPAPPPPLAAMPDPALALLGFEPGPAGAAAASLADGSLRLEMGRGVADPGSLARAAVAHGHTVKDAAARQPIHLRAPLQASSGWVPTAGRGLPGDVALPLGVVGGPPLGPRHGSRRLRPCWPQTLAELLGRGPPPPTPRSLDSRRMARVFVGPPAAPVRRCLLGRAGAAHPCPPWRCHGAGCKAGVR